MLRRMKAARGLVLPLCLGLAGLLPQARAQGSGADPSEPAADPAPQSQTRPTPTPPVAPPRDTAPVQRVNIDGRQDAQDARRRSTASRIIYGREEIERMGDATVGEILKRLPGVTVGGRPGRGGDPRMRGLGGGYTQILVDGERMPPGFSLDAIEPDQIERIEILRAPVAEFGARAIAGTINIVLREEFRPRQNSARLGVASERGQPQASGSWTRGDRQGPLEHTTTASASARRVADRSTSTISAFDAQGLPSLQQRITSESAPQSANFFLSTRWRWQQGSDRLELQPHINVTRSSSRGQSDLEQEIGQALPPYAHADGQSQSQNLQARLGGYWQHALGSGSRLVLRLGGSLAQADSRSQSTQRASDGALVRLRQDEAHIRDTSFNHSGRWSTLLGADHSLVAGWELQANRRRDGRVLLDNGISRLADFGENVQASAQRTALFLQDEWEPTRRWGFNAGLRWEAIRTEGQSALGRVVNDSAVLTPLAHAVWRLAERSRDQVRLSLTRSYRSPSTAQLIARPTLSGLYPADAANQPTSPDRAGNPALRPEVARGLDLAFERYLPSGGFLGANLFARHIDDLIRNTRTLQTVVWSPVPRWVSSPGNIGSAQTAGLELEARFRAADLGWVNWPLTVRANASRFWSRVDQVPGPDNRLDQQPTWTANLGLDWALRRWPLTVGGNLNLTPGFVVRQFDAQFYEQGRKRVIDAYALWRLSALTQLRLSASNALPRPYETATTIDLDDGSRQRQQGVAQTRMNLGLRLELKF